MVPITLVIVKETPDVFPRTKTTIFQEDEQLRRHCETLSVFDYVDWECCEENKLQDKISISVFDSDWHQPTDFL